MKNTINNHLKIFFHSIWTIWTNSRRFVIVISCFANSQVSTDCYNQNLWNLLNVLCTNIIGRSTDAKEKCAEKREEIENQKWLFVAKTKQLLRKREVKIEKFESACFHVAHISSKDITNEKFMEKFVGLNMQKLKFHSKWSYKNIKHPWNVKKFQKRFSLLSSNQTKYKN